MANMVPPDVYQERMLKCSECHLFEKHRGICKGCGCFMTIKARAGHTHCPLDRWSTWQPAES